MDVLRSVPEVEAAAPAHTFADITSPLLLQQGMLMTKVSNNKKKKLVFKLDLELGEISWKSEQRHISAYIPSLGLFSGLTYI